MSCDLRVFGIRHHGPGSARSLLQALKSFEADTVLVEGPPDANDLIPLAASNDMHPPVALMIYAPDEPQRAVFYPFAVFSPEWIAIRHALARGVRVEFMDLPQTYRLGRDDDRQDESPDADESPTGDENAESLRSDPLGQLAAVAGFSDSERWWDYLVESRSGAHVTVFDAIADAMTALREQEGPADSKRLEAQREAFMRKTIRDAVRRGSERLAVICGAWHAPALRNPHGKGCAGEDSATLKGLPKSKTAAAWVPWSYDRLSFRSGYGAGVNSPAYYDLLWTHDRSPTIHWMTRVARLMRKQDMDASSAHVIEAVRLADTLAALRERPLPGLEELDEAAQAVMCLGGDAPMRLIRRKLVIGDRLGRVPDDVPLAPLQQDLQQLQRRLRLPVNADEKDYDLDLRKPLDLERSQLLHRLNLLNVPWGERQEQYGKKGTFHEFWRVQWRPEFVVALVDASRWGNTIQDAATNFTIDRVSQADSLPELSAIVDDALLADLPQAVTALMVELRNRAAQGGDVLQLMEALPALARVTRYGNVRQTDVSMVAEVCDGLVARICVGVIPACSSLDDDAARSMFGHVVAVNDAIALLQRDEHRASWRNSLVQLADYSGLHGIVAGRAVRILYDTGHWSPEEVADRLSVALSAANEPAHAAAWIEGFLSGSGFLVVHDEVMWNLMDQWLRGLTADHFMMILPPIRRVFATFAAPERRLMAERAARSTHTAPCADTAEFDHERAALVLPVLRRIFGVEVDHDVG
ncbi:MAG: hypothetical protein J5J06_06245 [Phycisphaerae bacterium]|nr:hypothetical protein [Phycisphaerae bacterium]